MKNTGRKSGGESGSPVFFRGRRLDNGTTETSPLRISHNVSHRMDTEVPVRSAE